MNLFEFYRDATLSYLRDFHGINGIDATWHSQLQRELATLLRAYGAADPIDYSPFDRRVAYMLHLAPRHAIIWRRYLQSERWSASGNVRLNSFGTGPGSELIGYAEGVNWNKRGRVVVRCLEQELEWRDMCETVFSLYEERTGQEIAPLWIRTVEDFQPQTHTLGSFVLSDLARQGVVDEFQPRMSASVGPARGTFLDCTAFKEPSGRVKRLTDVVHSSSWSHLPSKGIRCAAEINAEAASFSPVFCPSHLNADPNVNVFKYRF